MAGAKRVASERAVAPPHASTSCAARGRRRKHLPIALLSPPGPGRQALGRLEQVISHALEAGLVHLAVKGLLRIHREEVAIILAGHRIRADFQKVDVVIRIALRRAALWRPAAASAERSMSRRVACASPPRMPPRRPALWPEPHQRSGHHFNLTKPEMESSHPHLSSCVRSWAARVTTGPCAPGVL